MNVTNTKNHRLFKMYVLLGALFCAFPMTTEKAFSEVPRGVFCLQPVGQGTGSDPIVYSDPDVDGISVRQNWADLEPIEGVYDWRFLDQVIGTALLLLLIFAITDELNTPPGSNMAPLMIGLVVVAIGMSFGGMHGYAINPARDFGPRLQFSGIPCGLPKRRL